ncbi:hypothetical protein BKA93DRAFT_306747 [Sparassis latifolia]
MDEDPPLPQSRRSCKRTRHCYNGPTQRWYVPQYCCIRDVQLYALTGTVYFASLLFLNVFALGIGQLADLMAVMTTWTAVITSILTSRFMLDLREAATVADLSGISESIPLRTMNGHMNNERSETEITCVV